MSTQVIAASIGNAVGIRDTVNQDPRPKMQIALIDTSDTGTGTGQIYPTGR